MELLLYMLLYVIVPAHYIPVLQDDSNWNSAAISIASITGSCSATFRIKSSSEGGSVWYYRYS